MVIEIAIWLFPLLRPTIAVIAVMFILRVFSRMYLMSGLKKIFFFTASILLLFAADSEEHYFRMHTISVTKRIKTRKMIEKMMKVAPKFLNRSSLPNRERPTFSPGLSSSN